jgi:predicted nucleic acid-binding protein
MRVVLDSGGLTSLCGRARRASETIRWLIERRFQVVVPTPILVECTTGTSRDAEVNRILKALSRNADVFVAPDDNIARRAGVLRFRARTDDGIDALVAAIAMEGGRTTVLLTSDPADMQRLLSGQPHVQVVRA